jgi:hypothetical protein
MLSPQPKTDDWALWVEVKCNRCGEIIRARIDLRNDLSVEYGENDADTVYFCRKGLMGSGRCYVPVDVELTFDRNHKLIHHEVRGGTFVNPEE